ncbi:MAG: hypothetical protein ISS15_14170 [Alphaproteobacteria bacterium]|nr:hypothetical protein [Alphaproteobacteria bacterium]MBL7098800.1 hypothetical protein [Alphaproteobacteria bacterium]
MRALLPVAVIAVFGSSLSGCIAYDVASAGVSVATTAVSTTAHVAGSVVGGAADTVSGSDDDSDSHKHHHHDGDDDSDK